MRCSITKLIRRFSSLTFRLAWNSIPYAGTFYVSVVGFMFERTRLLGAPIPGHQNFEEVNLRFYVRRDHPDGARRGVVFVKEIVPKRAIAAIARGLYNENYAAMPMSHRLEGRSVEYGWKFSGAWNFLRIETEGEPIKAQRDSLEEFITEHYWGYTKQRHGGCLEYRVEHPPWQLWRSARAELVCDAGKLYGAKFASPLSCAPKSAFLAEGSPVTVYRGVTLHSDGSHPRR